MVKKPFERDIELDILVPKATIPTFIQKEPDFSSRCTWCGRKIEEQEYSVLGRMHNNCYLKMRNLKPSTPEEKDEYRWRRRAIKREQELERRNKAMQELVHKISLTSNKRLANGNR